MRCEELIRKIEETYPCSAALGFDNVGLLVGRIEKDVHKIYITVDVTDQAVEEAIHFGADLIISHHPLIFSAIKRITDQDFLGRRLVQLLQNDISYYAMHTNYDVLRMADLASDLMGLEQAEVLDVTGERSLPDGKEESTDPSGTVPAGIGTIGNFGKEMSLESCADLVKERFGLDRVRVYGDLGKKVSRVALCPGSGKSVIHPSLEKNAQVLVTGDIGHHEGIDAVAEGLAIIDAGHYGMEFLFLEDMERFIKKTFPDMETQAAPKQQPFQNV